MSISTTLITFLLRAPSGTFTVELFGSWDNFSKPYKLSRDRRTGDNNWRGCHFFEGITCDGDTSDLSAMRNGGLMMGGTYWYFYRLNAEIEYHDPEEPYTSSCPLLPGQPVNVLDVPMQPPKTYSGNDSSDSLDSMVFTLDPQDKYLQPRIRRALTTSAIQQRKTLLPLTPTMDTAKSDHVETDNQSQTPSSTRDGPTLRPQRSLISIFDKMRRTKSAGSSTPRATTSWHRKVFSRAGSRAGLNLGSSKKATPLEDIPAVPQVPNHILGLSRRNSTNKAAAILDEPENLKTVDPTESLVPTVGNLSLSHAPSCHTNSEILADQKGNSQNQVPNTSLQGKFGAPSRPSDVVAHVRESEAQKPEAYEINLSETIISPEIIYPSSKFHAAAANLQSSILHHQSPHVGATSPTPFQENLVPNQFDGSAPMFDCADSSYATDENFSPNIASKSTQSGLMSPCQLSQPETPIMSDIGDDAVSWRRGSDLLDVDVTYMKPPSRAAPPPPSLHQQPMFSNPFRISTSQNGFAGFDISHEERGSSHTIQKPFTMSFDHSEHGLHHQTSSKDLVHLWDDGLEQRLTGLEELVDELGYLGAFIE